jgi:hypothetical protein
VDAEAEVGRLRAALEEILRHGRSIIAGQRLVGGPRAAPFDLTSVAAKAMGEEIRGPQPDAQATWTAPEVQPKAKEARTTAATLQKQLIKEFPS